MNTTGLTDDEMRVRIAERAGPWTFVLSGNPHNPRPYVLIKHEGVDKMRYFPHELSIANCLTLAGVPDYLNDLNAMHVAEKTLTKEQRKAWILALAKVLYEEHPGDELNLVSATARERALAFLAMLPEPEAGR